MNHPTVPTGRCPRCSRRVRVTARGMLAVHGLLETCPGSGLAPKGPVR